jgi:hypothetical protein
MYAVCQSYLPKACLEFSTLVHRAVDDPECTAEMVCLSEEAQWLRAACERNRARIIAAVCKSLRIAVPTIQDYRAASAATEVAMIANDTLHHDMTAGASQVRVLNYCADTSTAHNGSLCTMAPWDGVWAFCGAQRDQRSAFGMLHGKRGVVLPTAAPQVKQRAPHHLSFTSFNTSRCKPLQIWRGPVGAVRSACVGEAREAVAPPCAAITAEDDPVVFAAYQWALLQSVTPMTMPVPLECQDADTAHTYLDFDEHVLDQMARLGWNRSHGVAKLVPLACALYDHWKRQ